MAYVFKNAQGAIIAAITTEHLGEGWSFIENTLRESAPFRESDI